MFIFLPFVLISLYVNFFTEAGPSAAYSILLGAITGPMLITLYRKMRAKRRASAV